MNENDLSQGAQNLFAFDWLGNVLDGVSTTVGKAKDVALGVIDDLYAFRTAREQLNQSENAQFYTPTSTSDGQITWSASGNSGMDTQKILLFGAIAVAGAAILGWALK